MLKTEGHYEINKIILSGLFSPNIPHLFLAAASHRTRAGGFTPLLAPAGRWAAAASPAPLTGPRRRRNCTASPLGGGGRVCAAEGSAGGPAGLHRSSSVGRRVTLEARPRFLPPTPPAPGSEGERPLGAPCPPSPGRARRGADPRPSGGTSSGGRRLPPGAAAQAAAARCLHRRRRGRKLKTLDTSLFLLEASCPLHFTWAVAGVLEEAWTSYYRSLADLSPVHSSLEDPLSSSSSWESISPSKEFLWNLLQHTEIVPYLSTGSYKLKPPGVAKTHSLRCCFTLCTHEGSFWT
ncbi:uncharacterized protein LOC129215287 [Grus americana]|uniref:uncharacterized protein LOC129215287 n=1 Tax=Grus americana TaxID=9117 RepID=UPI0024084C40|nr:uncharacterized protein LOC129215287 [Grus americana]